MVIVNGNDLIPISTWVLAPSAASLLGRNATVSNSVNTEQDDPNEPVPLMQRVLDNPFLLLFLGVTIPAVLYIIWGVMEIIAIPIAE